MTCGIYMIQNKVNNKMYIGQSKDIEDRWKDHRKKLKGGYHENKYLQSDWNKYEQDNFEFSILLECKENQFNTYEQYYIFELMTYDTKVGYNKTYGGEGGKPTNEIRRKLSETKIGKNNPNYGKPLSNETKRKLSEANKGKNNPMYGKTGEKHPKSKPVVQIDIKNNKVIKVWGGIREAERLGGFKNGNISECCRCKQKSHKGFKWMFLEDYNKLNL